MLKKYISILCLFFVFTSYLSCDNEPLEGDFPSSQNPVNPDNPNTENPDTSSPPTAPGEGSTGDYWPTAVGNKWNFETTNADGTTTENNYEILSETTYDGIPAFELSTFLFDDQLAFDFDFSDFPIGEIEAPELSNTGYLIKNEGNYGYYSTSLDVSFGDLSMSVSPFGYVFFKDYLLEGESFESGFTYETTFGIDPDSEFADLGLDFSDMSTVIESDFESTIVGRDIEMTVNEVNFSEVIHLRFNTTYVDDTNNEILTGVSEIYLAKDIGPIKMVYTENDELGFESSILSYELN